MNRADTLRPVAQLADDREQRAASALASAQSALDAQRAKLDELERYRQGYVDGLEGDGGRAIGGIRETRLFILRLQQAISQQHAVVRDARAALEAARAHWLAQRRHAQALSRVMADSRLAAQRERLLAEQRDDDERSVQRAARIKTG